MLNNYLKLILPCRCTVLDNGAVQYGVCCTGVWRAMNNACYSSVPELRAAQRMLRCSQQFTRTRASS